MADLVVGLAKSVVEGALTKAQAAIEEEAKLRQGAKRDLVFITGEFRMMQSFLNVANEERVENKVVRTWVTQVRELAYDVEDCIELVVHLDKKKTSFWLRMTPSCICMAPPLPLDEALEEIEQLKARVKDVSKRNARYSLISDTGSKPVIVQQQPATGAAVGGAITTLNMLAEARDAAKRQQVLGGDLTQLITTDDADEVISVWGTGGHHGITSAVMKTYADAEICQNFTYRAWVKLTHPFVPHDFVLSLMTQFYASLSRQGKQERATIGMHVLTKMQATQEDVLFKEFERIVTKERYLVVLEGLSSMVDWHSIRTFLPQGKNGSRIIVSTHQSEIATLCIGHSYQILELKQFSAEHSVCVLFNKGSSGDADKGKKPMLGNSSMVGRGSQLNELHKYSAKARMSPSKIMSVWGIAGVGKSALVAELYNHLCNKDDTRQPYEKQFTEYHWVDVSHPFNLRDFCRNLLSDFQSGKDPIEECHQLLKQHRCLIVIDDIRSEKDWELIKTSLVPRSSQSVIIVITTDASLAAYCANNKELVFNVKGLEAAAAFDLFKQEVRKRLKLDPSSSVDWSEAVEVKELILKCGGLPKVIVAIAGALAKQTVTRMDTILSLNRRFMHHLETKPDYDGLGDLFAWMHSYFRTCPDSLKPCIFYSAIFPQDQIIRRRRLVRRWIAEGYSRDGDDISGEENGEQQFSELLDLSILQQVPQLVTTTEFSDKRMAMCKVNGFIREYIIPLRKEENLVFELVGNCALTTQRTGRHLVIMDNWDRDRIVFENIDFSRLRSLTVFGKWESFFISESMKLLRVLDLEDATEVEYDDLKKMVKWLRRLKFLSLRGRQEIYQLPTSLDHLRQLQTLDVRGTSIVTLPRSITKLQKLQYIRAGIIIPVASAPPAQSSWFCRSRCTVGVEVPRGIGELTALHTLGVVDVGASGGKAILEELEKLTQLRKLGVSGINNHNSNKFLSVIEGHGHLESLSVQLDKDNQGCLANISLPLDNLQSLKLYGLENGLPLSSSQFSRLRKLALEMDTLMQNDIDFLANLPELCILRLQVKQQLQGGRLHFYAEMSGEQLVTFKKVKILEISCSSSELHTTFGSKSMQNVELLKLDYSSATYQLVGLNNLSELKEVFLKGTNNDETFRKEFESHLADHPKRPAVKLEEVPHSS